MYLFHYSCVNSFVADNYSVIDIDKTIVGLILNNYSMVNLSDQPRAVVAATTWLCETKLDKTMTTCSSGVCGSGHLHSSLRLNDTLSSFLRTMAFCCHFSRKFHFKSLYTPWLKFQINGYHKDNDMLGLHK